MRASIARGIGRWIDAWQMRRGGDALMDIDVKESEQKEAVRERV